MDFFGLFMEKTFYKRGFPGSVFPPGRLQTLLIQVADLKCLLRPVKRVRDFPSPVSPLIPVHEGITLVDQWSH